MVFNVSLDLDSFTHWSNSTLPTNFQSHQPQIHIFKLQFLGFESHFQSFVFLYFVCLLFFVLFRPSVSFQCLFSFFFTSFFFLSFCLSSCFTKQYGIEIYFGVAIQNIFDIGDTKYYLSDIQRDDTMVVIQQVVRKNMVLQNTVMQNITIKYMMIQNVMNTTCSSGDKILVYKK